MKNIYDTYKKYLYTLFVCFDLETINQECGISLIVL